MKRWFIEEHTDPDTVQQFAIVDKDGETVAGMTFWDPESLREVVATHNAEYEKQNKPIRSVERYAYVNTSSEAGDGEKVTFNPDDVTRAFCWTNMYGNPTYSLFLEDGTTLLLVDDYGAMNDINHISARTVQRKKDLF
ncbi:MAG: hypothetical protein KAS93_06705 [Gammaproteobacteria bacterium]|nr:hypothetical protein [Gammaproteobacteria bacterium]